MAKAEDGLGVILALGKPKAKGGAEPDTDDEEGGGSARELAASAFIKAVKAGDAAGVADAFEELQACCGGMGGEPDADD